MSEEKQTWYDRYNDWWKAFDRKLFAPFYRTKVGAKWLAFAESLETRKNGNLIRIAVIVAVVLIANFGVRAIISTAVTGSQGYKLTQAQIDAGFSSTAEEHLKFDIPDDVANRFLTEDEEQSTPDCEVDVACWDFKLIALKEGCQAFYVKLDFFDSDNQLAKPVDSVEETFKTEGPIDYAIGQEYDFRLGSANDKSVYASFNRAYCLTYSGK